MLHVIERRCPGLEIILAPCRVQGDGAAAEIAGAIRLLNEWNETRRIEDRLDLILITRGGGSLEDLWAFNEETVARAIFSSALPIVSAVGHEIDFTISDFVADLRAATPSAAAEIITEGMFASRQSVLQAHRRLWQLVQGRLELDREDLGRLRQRLARVHPRRVLEERLQYLDELSTALARGLKQGWRVQVASWNTLRQRLARVKPSAVVAQRREQVQQLHKQLRELTRHPLSERRQALASLHGRLTLLSPGNVLARGYSITLDETTGRVVRSPDETRPGQRLRTRLQNGEVRSTVTDHS